MGDRIIAINGVNVDGAATAHQALKLVQEGGEQLDMEVVFDITGMYTPRPTAGGIYTYTLCVISNSQRGLKISSYSVRIYVYVCINIVM